MINAVAGSIAVNSPFAGKILSFKGTQLSIKYVETIITLKKALHLPINTDFFSLIKNAIISVPPAVESILYDKALAKPVQIPANNTLATVSFISLEPITFMKKLGSLLLRKIPKIDAKITFIKE